MFGYRYGATLAPVVLILTSAPAYKASGWVAELVAIPPSVAPSSPITPVPEPNGNIAFRLRTGEVTSRHGQRLGCLARTTAGVRK